MKSMMKKTLSVIIALAMILVPMSVFAATGDYEEPYQLSTSSVRFYVEVAPEATVWIQADDCNNSVVEVGYATGTDYLLQYGRQSVYPEADGTATLTLMGYDMFSVYNYGTETIYVYMSLTAGTPVDTTGTMEDPKEVTLASNMFGGVGAYEEVALESGNEGYYYSVTAPKDGIITVAINAVDADYNFIGWMYNVTNMTTYTYGDMHWSDDEEPVRYEAWEVNAGDELVVFASTYDPSSWTNPVGTLTVEFTFEGVGSSNYPETITETGSYAADIDSGSWGYYYNWTATEAGVATVTMNDATGWQYSLMVEPASEEDAWYYGDMHWSDDSPVVSSESVEVAAGDTLIINVCTYNPNSNAPEGTVNWTLDFEAGATLGGEDVGGGDEGGEDVGGGDDIGGGDEGGDDVNYVNNGEFLAVGDNMYIVDGGYEYTVYTFQPTEVGNYVFESTNSLIGIVSYTDMWMQFEPSEDFVNASSFEWECTDVNQAIMVAVKAETNVANINITREELDTSDDIVWIDYENMTTPEAFTFEENADELVYIDIEDDVDDSENVYFNAEDGYYHYGSENGPVVYVNLDDSMMSVVALVGNGSFVAANTENGVVTEYVDCTNAIIEYINCADVVDTVDEDGQPVSMTLYPLTDDLIAMYVACGTYLDWYSGETWVHDSDDAWMFACYYVPATEDGGDDNTGDDNTGNVGDDDNTGNAGDGSTGAGDAVADPEIPNTNAEAFGVAFAMMATAAALGATAVATKKSKRVK